MSVLPFQRELRDEKADESTVRNSSSTPTAGGATSTAAAATLTSGPWAVGGVIGAGLVALIVL